MAGLTVEQALRQASNAFAASNLVEAETLCRQILARFPNEAGAMQLLAIIGMHVGQTAAALDLFHKAVTLRPNDPALHANYAHGLKIAGRYAESKAHCQQALALNPDHAQACKVLAATLSAEGNLVDAIASYRRAIALNPTDAESYAGIATLLAECGRVEESIEPFRHTLRLRPGLQAAHCNLLFSLFSHPTFTPQAIADEHRDWARVHAQSFEQRPRRAYPNPRDANRRLKIGYVSNDFRDHPVGRFILPVLEAHDRQQFEVFAYSNSAAPDDAVTAGIKRQIDHWHAVPWLSDDAVDGLIRQHQIDVLIDLTGHTTRGRLLVFTRRPAPVQVAYLAYPGTTGLQSVDYRLTDDYTDPPGQTEAFHTETLLRLSETFLAFRPPPDCPPVRPIPPVGRDGSTGITFGCFNTLRKINEPLIAQWCRLLGRVPNSRLLLKGQAFGDEQVREQTAARFERQGIARDRVLLRPWEKTAIEHLAAYQDVDVALDTHPYSGTTTTCEALWMGVPVVTLAGQAHVSRVSGSVLRAIGRPEWIATTAEEYLEIAASLAGDAARLAAIRNSLRDAVQTSPLCDAGRLTRAIEHHYRDLWRQWCDRHPAA